MASENHDEAGFEMNKNKRFADLAYFSLKKVDIDPQKLYLRLSYFFKLIPFQLTQSWCFPTIGRMLRFCRSLTVMQYNSETFVIFILFLSIFSRINQQNQYKSHLHKEVITSTIYCLRNLTYDLIIYR